MENKFKEIDELSEMVENLKKAGKRVGLSHGVFDLVHPGHIQHFIAAKKEVDYLIVSITADNFVNKGPGRPIFQELIRISTLTALSVVDFVTISREKTAEKVIDALKPNLYFKGSDYVNQADDPTGKIEDERLVVEKHGGRVFFTNEMTSSSSKLINNYLNTSSLEIRNWLNGIKSKYSLTQVVGYLNEISRLKVAIIGEVILDEYTKVEALSKSSKDPILAFRLLDSELYAGGILAIANNCSSWVSQVKAVSTIGTNDVRPTNLAKILNSNIDLKLTQIDRPTVTKHRYIDIGTNTKLFETYDFNPDPISRPDLIRVMEDVTRLGDIDLILIADYGHGLLTREFAETLTSSNSYLCVNTQANAGNRGFNTITKYSRADFFSANSGELKLELRSEHIDFDEVMPNLIRKMHASKAILTRGADGLSVYTLDSMESSPAIATKIIDKVGAGDSVFAISSLLSFVDAPLDIIGFVASLVASHEVSQLGHRNSLSLGDLKKQIRTMMS